MKFILGTKERMTQLFTEDGAAYPATVVSAGPIIVTQVKNADSDGYDAVQVGFGSRSPKNIAKPQKGAWGDLGSFRHVKEFRLPTNTESGEMKKGDTITVDGLFDTGDKVTVTGISKGKGFQGVVKRHGFAGGRRSHGNKHHERTPGSIGVGGVQRVIKGVRMAGRMGTDRVAVKNLEVLAVDIENNQLIIKGALPGRTGTLLEIVKA